MLTAAQLEATGRVAYSTPQTMMPYLIGMWLDSLALGTIFVLVFHWVRLGWEKERRLTKILVIYLFVISIAISVFILTGQVMLFAVGFGKYASFLNPHFRRVFWMLSAISRIPTVLFFAHRAWLVSGRSIVIPIIFVPLALTSLGAAIGACIVGTEPISALDSLERTLVTLFTCSSLAMDFVNTLTISVGLYRSRTGWKSTDSLISYLLLKTAETQLPPTLVALAFLCVWLGAPNNTWAYLWQGISKVHVICLLVVVTSRFKAKNLSDSGPGTHELQQSRLSKLQGSNDSQPPVDTIRYTLSNSPNDLANDAKSDHPSIDDRHVGADDGRHWVAQTNSKTSLV